MIILSLSFRNYSEITVSVIRIKMKPEEKLLIKARSHKDGHLFEVSETAVEWIEQYQHFKGVTKSIVELLNLISLRGFSSKDGYVSTTEIIESTDGQVTRAALQQRLRAAVNIGLFKQIPVRFEEGLAGKTMLHRFVNPNQLISVLGATSLVTESVKQNEKQKRSKALAQTKVNKRLLNEHGLNTPPTMKDEADQFIVSPTNWAGIIDQALAPPRTRKSYQKSMVSISGTRAVIETRSSKNIMTVDDLMTLFALFTLTVQYHDHHQDDYHLDAKHTPNKTHSTSPIFCRFEAKKTAALHVTQSVTVLIVSSLQIFNCMSLLVVGLARTCQKALRVIVSDS